MSITIFNSSLSSMFNSNELSGSQKYFWHTCFEDIQNNTSFKNILLRAYLTWLSWPSVSLSSLSRFSSCWKSSLSVSLFVSRVSVSSLNPLSVSASFASLQESLTRDSLSITLSIAASHSWDLREEALFLSSILSLFSVSLSQESLFFCT